MSPDLSVCNNRWNRRLSLSQSVPVRRATNAPLAKQKSTTSSLSDLAAERFLKMF